MIGRIVSTQSHTAIVPVKPVAVSPVTSARTLRLAGTLALSCTSRKLSVSARVIAAWDVCKVTAGSSRPRKPCRKRRFLAAIISRSRAIRSLTPRGEAGCSWASCHALVPGRAEKGNRCRYVKGWASIKARLSSNNASLSPGKPTITSAPMAASGMLSRIRLSFSA